jgi:dihydrolipoamide dehydrogenase
MKKNKIDVINGFGKLKSGKKIDVTDKDKKVTEYSADHISLLLSSLRELPNLPQDDVKVIGYERQMTLATQPKSMIIVGSGAIGVELHIFYNAMGTEVTIVEFMPNIVPVEDEDISKQMERSMKSRCKIMTNSSVEKIDTSGAGVKRM